MTELQPKQFQLDALDALRRYLEAARLFGPSTAFIRVANQVYHPAPEMEDVPTVCLRLPTGGGKTMLAAMSVAVVAQSYLDRDYPVVLWLAPSDTIRSQTYRALANPDHPYRRALGKQFGDKVRVFDIADFVNLTPQDIRSNVCVIVGTTQSLQVTNTAGRKVYAHNENLAPHFENAGARAVPGLELIEPDVSGAGTPKYSFANLMKVQRPLLILDEAHRFWTGLADQVRQRLGAGVVLELTATPLPGSNELYRASAAEVKLAEMIKLPVVLAEHTGLWEQAVHESVATRANLQQLAKHEPQYVRPILLIQAQNAGSEADWRNVKKYLIESEDLSPAEIAVHTGDVRELDGVDLFAESCPITTIITVQALKEGWDCSFAYVLCSTANIGSAMDVEQLLGRVLRMPYAKARVAADLNKAYAHVASERFHTAATALRDSLIHMGFEKGEAEAAVQSSLSDAPLFDQPPPFELPMYEAPDFSGLSQTETEGVELEPMPSGQVKLIAHREVKPGVLAKVLAALPQPLHAPIIASVKAHNAAWAPSPAQRGVSFAVPQLMVRDETEQLVLFTKTVIDEATVVDLRKHPADVNGFNYDSKTQRYIIDIVGEHVTLDPMGQELRQTSLMQTEITKVQLAAWLSEKLRDKRINSSMMSAWVLDAVTRLIDARNISLSILDRGRFILFRELEATLIRAREDEEAKSYHQLLFAHDSSAVTTDEWLFRFPSHYSPSYWCKTKFTSHYYSRAGEMKDSGEEYDCALIMDIHPRVKHWVRNLGGKGRENDSFWLQTKTDRFYPDFVAEIDDGTILVVEYKGDGYKTNDDSKEKDELGRIWAARSGGRAKFLMAVKNANGRDVAQQIDDAIRLN